MGFRRLSITFVVVTFELDVGIVIDETVTPRVVETILMRVIATIIHHTRYMQAES